MVRCEQGGGGGEERWRSTATVLRRWIGGAEESGSCARLRRTKGGVSAGGAVAEVRGDSGVLGFLGMELARE